ncbi:MAG TPA: cupin domain-containing protein [Steroidobacter sp.]|nr:cupin domain-containing protein [Steroidobacter sp.]
MLLNADFSKRTVVHAGALEWMSSPAKGVERRMLFRVGEERARATSIVRYAPGSHFSRHGHAGGEEFLVLEGTFQDETGDFPTATYVRNPPGTGHAPGAETGCTIFVKLWQFKKDDRERVVRFPGAGNAGVLRPGVASSLVLFDGADERVMLETWDAGAEVELANPRGLELLVLAGAFSDGVENLDRWTWLRLPAGERLVARVGSHGARVWYKSAPLLHDDVCAFESGSVEKANR